MSIRPTLVLDTCALKHLDCLTLSRRPLVAYLIDAFELRVPPEVFDELKRHIRGMDEEERLTKTMPEWRMKHQLDDDCLRQMLVDLPSTVDWYEHPNFYPTNRDHLFAQGQNAGERDVFLLFYELTYSGRTPILLTDDLKACRVALRDLINWKLRTGVLWITLDFAVYLIVSGLKRCVKKKVVNQFTLAELNGVIRDLVLRISRDQILQQKLITHYSSLAKMMFTVVDANEGFSRLEKKYAKDKYR